MGLDLRGALVEALVGGLGIEARARPRSLPVFANDREFVEHYGLRVDGRSIRVDGEQRHLGDVYEDDARELVLMAGAQSGKSVRVMVRALHAMLRRWGGMWGYYFPDQFLPRSFSRRRFSPMLRSSPALGEWVGRTEERGKGEDAVLARQIGPATLLFLTIGGRTSTEGNPMNGVFFDEVRRMQSGDIERAMERTSAQQDPLDVKASTARFPGADIHQWFMRGDQRYFHTACGCPEGVVLATTWPSCVAVLDRATPELRRKVEHAFRADPRGHLGLTDEERARWGEAAYVCPRCGEVIVDPREGWWEAHGKRSAVHSYQFPQILVPTWPAARMWTAFMAAKEPQEFHNSKLGLPFLDETRRPITRDHLEAAIEWSVRWPATRSEEHRRGLEKVAMGVDCQAGFNVCVLKQPQSNGRWRTIHLEVVGGDDPFREVGRLIIEWGVRACVIDALPHWNETLRLAQAFRGRVWLAQHVEARAGQKMASWGEAKRSRDQRGSTRWRWTVSYDRIRTMKWALGRWKDGLCEIPPPRGLLQQLPVQGDHVVFSSGLRQGRMEPWPITEVYWQDLLSVQFVDVYEADDDRVREARHKWELHVVDGATPSADFAFAELFADLACSRLDRRGVPDLAE